MKLAKLINSWAYALFLLDSSEGMACVNKEWDMWYSNVILHKVWLKSSTILGKFRYMHTRSFFWFCRDEYPAFCLQSAVIIWTCQRESGVWGCGGGTDHPWVFDSSLSDHILNWPLPKAIFNNIHYHFFGGVFSCENYISIWCLKHQGML